MATACVGKQVTMSRNVEMDNAIRVLAAEFGKDKSDPVVIGKTEEEKATLEKYAVQGKRRSLFGFVVGAATMTGLYKAMGGKRRFLGAASASVGALAGMSYGLLSIRQGLFMELLTIPEDKSPFAGRARRILAEQIPQNEFVKEIQARMREQGLYDDNTIDLWKEDFAVKSGARPVETMKVPDQFTEEEDHDIPPPKRNPFFFAQPQDQPSSQAYDPYAYGAGTSFNPSGTRFPQRKQAHHDQDWSAYGDDDHHHQNKDRNQSKPTTWDEIRRRQSGH